MNRVLVTGCSGFIGTALCKRLLADGWSVRGAVRSNSRSTDLVKGVEPAVIGSIGPTTEWEQHLTGVDAVIHLAAKVHDGRATDPAALDAYSNVNTFGTRRLAESCCQTGVVRFVYLSTLKVNGDERAEPYTESDPVNPIGPYGESKSKAEHSIFRATNGSRLEPVILRPPLVYGPGVKANFLQLLKIANSGVPLPLAGIENRRSLIFVENLVDAIQTVLTHPQAAGGTYLVSDRKAVSTPELVRKIALACGRPLRLFYFSPSWLKRIGAICGQSEKIRRLTGSLVADTRKIQMELNWQPRFDLTAGLDATAHWFLSGRQSGSRGTNANR